MLPDIKTILYASDIQEGSRPAFRMALKLAEDCQATVLFLHVCEPSDWELQDRVKDYLPGKVNDLHSEQAMQSRYQRIHDRINRFLSDEISPEVESKNQPEVLVRIGRPDQMILDVANEQSVDMIVMGDRATSTLSRMFLGSTSQSVTHQSNIPVLVVPISKLQ